MATSTLLYFHPMGTNGKQRRLFDKDENDDNNNLPVKKTEDLHSSFPATSLNLLLSPIRPNDWVYSGGKVVN